MKTAVKRQTFGTVSGAWDALRSIKAGETPSREVLDWLSAAIDRCDQNDPKQLLRELGLSVHGRRRTVNPDVIAKAVSDLVKGGASIMVACEMASKRIGCSAHAAYRWHRAIGSTL